MRQQRPTAGGADLLRSVGLLADGPGQWGRGLPASGPGVFVVELPAPQPAAPIELTRVGKWIERVPSLLLDGARPTSKALAARLGAFWLPSQTVVYVGSTDASIGRRLAAMWQTPLGDRRPSAAGHWLHTLRGLDGARIWWAATSATEEYEDALADAFAAGVPDAERATLPDPSVVLPFANLRRPDGRRKQTGLTASLLAEPVEAPAPPARITQLPEGDAEGARGEQGRTRRPASTRSARRPTKPARATTADAVPRAAADDPGVEGLTVDGAARLRAELDRLTTVKRPEVVARIRTAKEHGDLKENAEYHAAREEQSFLEGRIQALEARLRHAVVVEAATGERIGLGSRVRLETDGETVSYTIVGAAESDPRAGRISSSSPVGRALMGRTVGDAITVQTPGGELRFRVLEVG